MHKFREWMKSLLRQPKNEYDERLRSIYLLATRDVLVVVVLAILLLPALLQLPTLRGFYTIGLALLPILVILIVGIVGCLSLSLRGGWNWQYQGGQARLQLLIVMPLVTIILVLFGILHGDRELFQTTLAYVVGGSIFPLLVIIIAHRKR
jgi:hypothetical protein